MRAVLGKLGEQGAVLSLIIANWGSTIAWLKYIGDNLAHFLPEAGVPGKVFSMIATVVILPCALIDDVSFLDRIGLLGLVAAQSFAWLIIGHGIVDSGSFPAYVTNEPAIRWSSLPVAMGIAVFCNEGIVVMSPSVHAAMRKPQHYRRALLAMLVYFTVNYLAVAVAGDYLFSYRVGGVVKSEFSLSFDVTPLYRIAVCLYICQLLLSFPSMLFVVFASSEDALQNVLDYTMTRKVRRALRVVIIVAMGSFAVAVPQFGDFLALSGGLGNSLGIYMLPHLALLRAAKHGEVVVSFWRRAASIAVFVVFGVGCGIAATVVSFDQLFH